MTPSAEVLRRLYYEQGLASRQIGAMFHVSKTHVLRWMKAYGIERRATGRGLDNRGITPPTREELFNAIWVRHDSYDVIAEKYGVDRSAVQHWLRKHGIKSPAIWQTRRKTSEFRYPTRDELVEMYQTQGFGTEAIGKQFHLSGAAIRTLLRRHDIPIRTSGWADGKRFAGADSHIVKSTYELRVCEWFHEHGIAHQYEPQLPFAKRSYADFRVADTYIEIWGVTNSEVYERRKTRKQSLYRSHNVELVELYPHQFAKCGRWFRILEKRFLNPQPLFEQLALIAS